MLIIDKSVSLAEDGVTVKGIAPSAFAYALHLPAENSIGGVISLQKANCFAVA
jgi:hypothetical protein